MELANRAALITGGKRIGAAVARALAARGMDVALAYNRSRDEAEAVAAVVRGLVRRGFVIQAVLRRAEQGGAYRSQRPTSRHGMPSSTSI